MSLFKPRAQSPRSATTDQQQNGTVINTPRYAHLGGLSSAGKIGPKNKMGVQKPADGKRVI